MTGVVQSKSGMPPIAVVIPCWNTEKWVGRAIESALELTCADPQIIAIDDGSTDDTLSVLKSFGDRITVRTGPNRGQCAARNEGLSLVRADYVLFLDADDYLEAPLLSSLAAKASEGAADVIFGPSALEYSDGRRCKRAGFAETDSPASIFARILGAEWVPVHSILWRSEFIRSVGAWNEKMVLNDDGELLARALLKQPRISFSKEGCAVYVQHSTPGRVSLRRTSEAIACQIVHLTALALEIERTVFAEEGRPALARAAYETARESYANGFVDLGHRALRLSRALGFRRHRGSRTHRIAASILGLKLKEGLSNVRWRLAQRPS
jgi:hypothetical protein